jgi:hypothetical protein
MNNLLWTLHTRRFSHLVSKEQMIGDIDCLRIYFLLLTNSNLIRKIRRI